MAGDTWGPRSFWVCGTNPVVSQELGKDLEPFLTTGSGVEK